MRRTEQKDKSGRSEWSGACYSPDGKWLFVNLYQPRRHLRDHRSLGEGLDVSRRIVVASPGSVELGEEATRPGHDPRGLPDDLRGRDRDGAPSRRRRPWRPASGAAPHGTVTDVEADETFVVLSGRATIEHDGAAHEVGPGDVCVLPAGAETNGPIHETLTKVFVIVDADAGGLDQALRLADRAKAATARRSARR